MLGAGEGSQPNGLNESAGAPDDLKEIGGIGPVNEQWLHSMGIYHFWQVANWTVDECAWIAHHMPTANFGGRVYRENWVLQATQLARGEVTEAKEKYLRGEQI